jgi:hypothetical protein
VFQFDRTFDAFRAAKLASRAQKLDRYFCTLELREDVAREVNRFIVERLAREHPEYFDKQESADGIRLNCRLTSEALTLDSHYRLIAAESDIDPGYACALDALACQVQEDLAVVSVDEKRHWLSAAHVCLPNGWAPEEKVGRAFAAIHDPVAGMAEMNRRGGEFAEVMIGAQTGLVRFAWGVTFDDRLNHHPRMPRDAFDEAHPRAYLRVERQTIWGLAAVKAALFSIRTYLYDCDRLRRAPATRVPLVAALTTMTEESQAYKGLTEGMPGLMKWLQG